MVYFQFTVMARAFSFVIILYVFFLYYQNIDFKYLLMCYVDLTYFTQIIKNVLGKDGVFPPIVGICSRGNRVPFKRERFLFQGTGEDDRSKLFRISIPCYLPNCILLSF